jgi:cob(I)alamin adenosyltransferase
MKIQKAHPRVEAAFAVIEAKSLLSKATRKLGPEPREVKSILRKVNRLLLPVGRHLCEGLEFKSPKPFLVRPTAK